MGRINLAQDRYKWRAVVITVMNVWVLFVPTLRHSSVFHDLRQQIYKLSSAPSQ